MRWLTPLALAAACNAPPDPGALFHQVELQVAEGGEAAGAYVIEVADAATDTLHVALPTLDDVDVADALVDAHDRGVQVELVIDVDAEDSAGVAAIVAAGVPLQLADGPVAYTDIGLGEDLAWRSEQVRMTHAFAVADRTRWTATSGAGDREAGARVVLTGLGEDIGEDLISEHVQVFGGIDASARTAFDAMAKNVVDSRWLYPTQDDELLEVWFNPQERTIKRLIDAVYRARSSIRLMAEDVLDEGIARALQRKAEDGFDVEVLVGSRFGTTSVALSDVLRNQAPDVPLRQVTTLDPLPTILFVDYDRARDGRFHTPTAMILTHPVYSAARRFGGVAVTTDQLTDGTLLVLKAQGAPTAPLQVLADLYKDRLALAEALR